MLFTLLRGIKIPVIIPIIDGKGHLSWFAVIWTRVRVAVILRQEIDVVKDETFKLILQQQSLFEANVKQHSSVERRTVCYSSRSRSNKFQNHCVCEAYC